MSTIVLSVLAAFGTGDTDMGAVCLAGTPAEIGTTWGRVNADFIRRDIDASFLKPAAEKGLSPTGLVERAKAFEAICESVAPHWLEEIRATADAAGVDPKVYTSYVGTVYRSLWMGDECTSYAVSPSSTKENALLFHKTRDNVRKPQAACIVASAVPDVNRFMTVTDAGVLSCMMMVNEKGLAGSADVGGLPPQVPRFRGMMNTYILRHVAERASDCHEALAIVREFVDKGWYAGGGNVGTHWLFMDRTGTILEIAHGTSELRHRYHHEKVYFSVREDSAAAKTLWDAEDPVDFHTFHNVSRDTSMCFDSSISGMTVEIHRDRPDLFTCAWFTFPAKGLAFPMFMGCTENPLPLVNGEVYGLCDGIDGAAETWETMERRTHADKERFLADIERGGADVKHDAVSNELNGWVRGTTDAQVRLLRLANGPRAGQE